VRFELLSGDAALDAHLSLRARRPIRIRVAKR
jgi:hypothetical protein